MDTATHSHSFSPATFQRPSRWITHERPKIDRIACPWLVLRFIDPQAEFLYEGGLSRLHEDDHAMLAAALPMYDALYAWCKGSQGESHGWNPTAMRAAQ